MNTYGYCPICGAEGVQRERGLNGRDACKNGHYYRSSKALDKPEIADKDLRMVLMRWELLSITCPKCGWYGLLKDLERKMWCCLCPSCRVIVLGESHFDAYKEITHLKKSK